MYRRLMAVFLSVSVLGSAAAHGQPPSLAGAWERTSLRNAAGESTQPPAPAAFLVFTANGQWAQLSIPSGRPRVEKAIAELTKDELVGRYQGVEARRGTWTVSGSKLTRKNVASANPNQEGTDQAQTFRVAGDTLILASTDPASKAEARFRRIR